jgi:hypothetical protein
MSGPVPCKTHVRVSRGTALMPSRIEDYALLGDCKTAALISTGCAGHGSTRRLVLPRSWATATMAAGRSAHRRQNLKSSAATDATRWCRNRVHPRRWQLGGPGRLVSGRQTSLGFPRVTRRVMKPMSSSSIADLWSIAPIPVAAAYPREKEQPDDFSGYPRQEFQEKFFNDFSRARARTRYEVLIRTQHSHCWPLTTNVVAMPPGISSFRRTV